MVCLIKHPGTTYSDSRVDLETLLDAVKFAIGLASTQPLKDQVANITSPSATGDAELKQ